MELLAPAGNMECLRAAVANGADAVYFAGKSFGARSFANNFSEEEIREATKYCSLRNVKTYVTVNTLTLDKEFLELDRFISVLAEAGVDGVIVQDLGVLKRIREICPQMPIHGSTQMTVHNLEGVLELEKLGVTRVVLSRELSKLDMEYIIKNCKAEVEVFVHGAMCMSYSGQCLMSSVLGGRSGNRGKCAQPCRLAYHNKGENEKFYLSLKDMSLIEHLEELKTMKVASLKIEGRMKGADYVSTVVSIYRRCIDENRMPTKAEIDLLNRVFYRGGMTDGYFEGKKGREMFAFDKPDNPYAKGGELELSSGSEKLLPIDCYGEFICGEKPVVTMSYQDITVKVYGETVLEEAKANAARSQDIEKQLRKTGGTGFEIKGMSISIDKNPFVPVKAVNELRRKAVERLTEALLSRNKKEIIEKPFIVNKKSKPTRLRYTTSIQNLEQFEAVRKFDFKYIYVPAIILAENMDIFEEYKDKIVISLPAIIKDSEADGIKDFLNKLKENDYTKIRIENIGNFMLAKGFQVFGSTRLNITNTYSLQMYKDLGVSMATLSPELNLAQIRDIEKPVETEAMIYGYTPLMITENCILNNANRCSCSGKGEIYDRKNKPFYIMKADKSCRNILLNSVPVYMGDKAEDLNNSGISYGCLGFTIEDKDFCREICEMCFNKKSFNGEFTRLHFYKGVL